MTSSSPNPAWPLRSDAENAGRALALRAALDFAISPQQQRRGMLVTEERVLELAGKFAAWLADAEPAHFSGGTDIRDLQPTDTGHACDEAEALEAADPVIDAYIESDKRVMAMMQTVKPLDSDGIARGIAELRARIDDFCAVANNLYGRRRA